MAYLIDTNIAIHARDGTERVLERLSENDGSVLLSALSYAELQRGVYKHPGHNAVREIRLKVLVENIPILPFDAAAAEAYFDRMIAAHAIASGSILVTDNIADFRDIPGLTIENWATDQSSPPMSTAE